MFDKLAEEASVVRQGWYVAGRDEHYTRARGKEGRALKEQHGRHCRAPASEDKAPEPAEPPKSKAASASAPARSNDPETAKRQDKLAVMKEKAEQERKVMIEEALEGK